MTQLATEKNNFLANFAELEQALGDRDRPFLRRLRNAAVARFDQLGFPGPRSEDWRFTNVAPLAKQPFTVPPADNPEVAESFRLLTHGDQPGATLLCMNGNQPFLATGSGSLPKGAIVGSLAAAIAEHADLVEPHLGQLAEFKSHPFAALNTAFLRDGAFIYVPPGVVVEEPIYVNHVVSAWNREVPYVWHRRALIILGDNSRATLVEQYTGIPEPTYFTNAVTEVVVGKRAVCDHYKVQSEASQAYHIAVTQVRQEQASKFSTHYIGLGGALVRNEVRVLLGAENCEATVNGLYLAAGTQHMDNFTVIDHARPNCASHELYKGILGGKAHGVFNGKIFVRQDAQKTDAKQTNQTLLLSEDATINTKPQLEIFADDVKCTHGATVGQLDDEALFYLRSRGIGLAEARSLLIFAFANDIVRRIQVAPIRAQLEQVLLASQGLPAEPAFSEAV